MTPTPQKRLEDLIVKIERAQTDLEAGKRVDMRALDMESVNLHKQLKGKPDPAIQPTLMKAISAIERLTATLEDRLSELKNKK